MKSDINAPTEWYSPAFVLDPNAEHTLQNKYNTYVFKPKEVLSSNEEYCLVYGEARPLNETISTRRLLFINKTNKTSELHILIEEIKEFDETCLAVAVAMLKMGTLPPGKYLY